MEDINEKAVQDELNKSEEEIQETPRQRIPVPKIKQNKNNNYNDKMMQARDDGKFIKEKLYSVPVNISQAKFNLLDKYCKLLRLKDGKVDGFRKLPDAIKEYIKDNMHINNDNLVVAGGKIR